MLTTSSPYADPRLVTDARECTFYHTMDIPGHGLVEGEWDLRDGVDEYLGHVSVAGKRVLELGTASGFLAFSMERMGAEVVAHDLSDEQDWDIVPFAPSGAETLRAGVRTYIRRLNNGWWFAHRGFQSNARVVYGSIYDVPLEIGAVDIATFGSILLHLRDPFLALQNGLHQARETVIVTDVLPVWARPSTEMLDPVAQAAAPDSRMRFMPDFRTRAPNGQTWWSFSPDIIRQFIGVLGFEVAEVTYHSQKLRGRDTRLFTVVGHRTK